ncbi:hypothetical protein FOCC_FOCC013854 [Frankliniella occidentalis]|nr:hypothetical protein FOCC_FOCC013854 [Frankliniella occidentalis]
MRIDNAQRTPALLQEQRLVPQPEAQPHALSSLHVLQMSSRITHRGRQPFCKSSAWCHNQRHSRMHLVPCMFSRCPHEALKQHMRRAAYQAGIIWGKSLDKSWDNHPLPSAWGWKLQQGQCQWVPRWTDREDIWRTCRELSACGCASGCGTRRCSCRRAGVLCALSCKKSKGKCDNKKNDDPLPQLDEDLDGDLADS